MNYKNAAHILPDELVREIQRYVQGEYLYIPIREKAIHPAPTEYGQELTRRNAHIYTKFLEGADRSALADRYHLSASSIRRILLEERKRYESMNQRILQIIKEWEINDRKVTQIYDSAWQVGENAVLKAYTDVRMLQRNIKILTVLDGMGIPVGGILPTKNKESYAEDEEFYYIVTKRLSGSHAPDIQKRETALEMGRVLAKLHRAFRECEAQEEFWENSLLDELNGWVKDVFAKKNWSCVEERRFDDTVKNLGQLYGGLPVQLIHRDVHLGNFLFDEGGFSGYIDFDLSQKNIRIFDLCYFMLGLLSEEELLTLTEEQWFEVLRDFFAGYERECGLLEEEKQAVIYVMKSIELLFAAWFTEQNDTICARDAMRIYRFVEDNAERIRRTVRGEGNQYAKGGFPQRDPAVAAETMAKCNIS